MGPYATGVVGFGLLLLLVTGVVVHRRFFQEAFGRARFRRAGQGLVLLALIITAALGGARDLVLLLDASGIAGWLLATTRWSVSSLEGKGAGPRLSGP